VNINGRRVDNQEEHGRTNLRSNTLESTSNIDAAHFEDAAMNSKKIRISKFFRFCGPSLGYQSSRKCRKRSL
jgi:hypothetical protein